MTTIHVDLTEDEAERLNEIAHEFTSYCYETGKKPPDDPLRCLLGYFDRLADMVIAVNNMLEEDRRTATLRTYFPNLIE